MAFGFLGAAIGVVLVLIGIFLVIFFPYTTNHQTESFSLTGIGLGFALLIAGALLVFL